LFASTCFNVEAVHHVPLEHFDSGASTENRRCDFLMKINKSISLLLVAGLASGLFVTGCQTATTGSGALRSADPEIQRAVDAVYPALVRIHVVYEQGSEGRMQKRRSSGSGVIISEDGYIITNHHVAGRATRLLCRLSNREEVDAVLVGTDALSDIAVIKLDLASRRNPDAELSVASFGNSDEIQVGDVVLAMGSPAGLSQSVTKGIVANTAMITPDGVGMRLDGENVGELVRWIGHDAVIYPGNSGGPLVNLKGEIVGVNEVGIGSLGGAIPSNLAKSVARELMDTGRVARSWIGLEPQTLLKSDPKAEGVLVASILPNSPARAAGIQSGDLITEFNGEKVPDARADEDLPVFNRLVLSTPIGTQVTLKGVRDGQPTTWNITTTDREPSLANELELLNWGITVRDLTRVSALENDRETKAGIWVDSVRQGGPSADSKPDLRTGDILLRFGERPVENVQQLTQYTAEFTKGLSEPKPVMVTFARGREELATVVKIGPEPDESKPARPAKAWLGLQSQVLTRELSTALELEGKRGVRVTQILPDSPAEQAGLKAGDLLFKLDGQVIAASTPADQELFANMIREYKVGSEVELEGLRAGQPLKLGAKLGTQPKPNSDLDTYKDERFEFTARELSLNEAVSARLKSPDDGVRVATVQSAGWAALAGVAGGDILLAIDGKPVRNIAQLKQMMKDLAEQKPRRVVFFIKRGIYTEYFELEPRW
jgi:serine protease Do